MATNNHNLIKLIIIVIIILSKKITEKKWWNVFVKQNGYSIIKSMQSIVLVISKSNGTCVVTERDKERKKNAHNQFTLV